MGGEVFIEGSRQLLPRRRHKIIRLASRYFMFIFFIIFIIMALLYGRNVNFLLISLFFCFYSSTQARLGQIVFVTNLVASQK